MYEVILSKRAEKELDRLDTRYRQSIINRLDALKTNPLLGKKLNDNLKKYRSIREGIYRIIYEVKKNKLIILVVSVQHRQGVYKKI